ncbi:hypothetical protein MIMGU_mgv1a024809mg [Erythranthe guttata]|uniref:MATH domain-containing protein n=1 Tax=Erythranthe guttata TaxID=4155 RepID=A0A022Q3C6_ERYGU|nr:hypothetical protein MIMGU_mgv1a024809mg [Erythranthe guttata]
MEIQLTAMETREVPPAHFLFKIKSFSLLESCGIQKYETKEFVAGNHKWRLIIYPDGDDNVGNDKNHISVYLAMVENSSLSANRVVNAVFSIFLFNQNSGNYLCSLGITRRFQTMKSEWGFSKFISKKVMSEPSNGYLVDDKCVFGAEVFVVNTNALTGCLSLKTGCLSLKKTVTPYKRDWKIRNFSKLGDVWKSETFKAGGKKWNVLLHTKGCGGAKGNGVSIFLYYIGSESVKACFTIRIKNQVSEKHKIKSSTQWFSDSTSNKWGWDSFMKLATINDPIKGFINEKNCCQLDIEISVEAVAR